MTDVNTTPRPCAPLRLDLASLSAWTGREVGVSSWQQISQDMIQQFAVLTGDMQWIHVDVERAARSDQGGTIAHGMLTLSLIPAMRNETVELEGIASTINYGLNRVRFVSPVTTGSEVRGRFVLQESAPSGDKLLLTWQATVEIRGRDRPACVAELLTLVIPETG
jgi:acyl dehydratase